MPAIYWNVAFTLYLIGMTYWIGGGLFLATAGQKAVRLLEPAQRQNTYLQLLSTYVNTLKWVVPLCLVCSGVDLFYEGEIHHLTLNSYIGESLLCMMILIFAVLYGGSFQRLRRSIRPQESLFHRVRLSIVSMTIVGLIAIALVTLNLSL